MLLGICMIIVLCSCSKQSTNQVEESTDFATPKKDKDQIIYEEALDYAYDGNFASAVSKLNEFVEPYEDSEELIELFGKDISSTFIGTWHCSRANSCNDMDITLTIYPIYRHGEMQLYFERDMKSEAGKTSTGSSNITGTIGIPSSSLATVPNLNSAKWTVDGSILTELFSGDNNKQNTYTKR